MDPSDHQNSPCSSPAVLDRIVDLLRAGDVSFDVLRHEPVYTSEEAAQVRGTPLASGAKALVCKADSDFLLLVMPADRRLDSKRLRRAYQIRKLRFASRDDLLELTGLEPGSVPPFGSLFGLPTWCDELLAEQSTINFNAGDHSISISMGFEAYVAVEQPRMGRFSE